MKGGTDGAQAAETQQDPQEQPDEQAQHAEEEVAATDDGPDELKVHLAKQEDALRSLRAGRPGPPRSPRQLMPCAARSSRG